MWPDNDTTEDLLGFEVHKDLIKSFVLDKDMLPLTVGVFGDWGSGKTSILKMLKDDLSNNVKDKKIACVFINSWLYEGYDDAKAALIDSILESLEQNVGFSVKVKKNILDLLRRTQWLRIGGFLAKNIVIPTASTFIASQLGADGMLPMATIPLLNNACEALKKTEDCGTEKDEDKIIADYPTTQVVRDFRDKFEKMVEESGYDAVVVIVDDLDRCNPERIIENLEAIKLFVNTKKTAFIIGADERIVRHAVELRYGEITDGSSTPNEVRKRISQDYMEKIIQIPYRLPKLSNNDTETYMNMLICKRDLLKEDYEKVYKSYSAFKTTDKHTTYSIPHIKQSIGKTPDDCVLVRQIAPMLTEVLKGNPRQVKRFLNTFMIRKKLSELAEFGTIRLDVLAKLMALEYLDIDRFRNLFEWQQRNGGIAIEIDKMEKLVKDNQKDEFGKNYPDWAMYFKWINVDPSLGDINLSDYFWLTRDALSSTVDGALIIPIIVRRTLESLENSSTDSSLRSIFDAANRDFSESDLVAFLKLLKCKLTANADNIKYWKMFYTAIELNLLNSANIFIDILKEVDWNKVSPGITVGLAHLYELNPTLEKAFIEHCHNIAIQKAYEKQKEKL